MRQHHANTTTNQPRTAVIHAAIQRLIPSRPKVPEPIERHQAEQDLRDLDQRVREVGEW
jgi:hypothetical protein